MEHLSRARRLGLLALTPQEQGDQAWTSDIACMALDGEVDCRGAGAWVKLVLSKLNMEPRPAIRWPGAGSAVSIDQRVASRDLCRNGYRPATLLLST